MATFRLKSLARSRHEAQEQAAGRSAETRRLSVAGRRRTASAPAPREGAGGANVLTATGMGRPPAGRELTDPQAAEAADVVEATELRSAEQALLLVVQARRTAARLRERQERRIRALTGKGVQHVPVVLASTAHHRSGDAW